jgi:glycine/D-amino acid oxidase-like deaminating enzyme
MTVRVDRRQFLSGAVMAAGAAALPATSAPSTERVDEEACETDACIRERYDKGLVPISQSRWSRVEASFPSYSSLDRDLDADVAVIGAGLAGGSLALHLAEAGIDVTILEARQPGWGASGRSAGHVNSVFEPRPSDRLPDGGEAYLALFGEEHSLCFDLAEKYDIDCDARQAGLIHAIQNETLFLGYARETADRRRKTCRQAGRWLQGQELKDLTGSGRYGHGVLWEDGGSYNPWAFTNGMVAAAVGLGAKVFGNSPAVSVERAGKRQIVRSERGSVKAQRVVFCTNGYTRGIIPELDRCYSPLTAYGLSTRPLPAELRASIMPAGSIMQQFPLNMHPFLVDGSGRIVTSLLPRLTCPEDPEPHFRDLLRWLHDTWPQSRDFDIEFEAYWTGGTAFSSDGFPKILEVDEGLLALMGFSGSGHVHAPLLGRHLAEALASDDPSRLPLPITSPEELDHPMAKSHLYRGVLIPLARLAEGISLI